jgi:hypothetical protein
VAKLAQTAIEFRPMQAPGSFNLEAIKRRIEETIKGREGDQRGLLLGRRISAPFTPTTVIRTVPLSRLAGEDRRRVDASGVSLAAKRRPSPRRAKAAPRAGLANGERNAVHCSPRLRLSAARGDERRGFKGGDFMGRLT